MPRDVVALVSVDDFVSAVRIYGDRVHDLLRRSGVGPEESVEVCEAYALALLDAVVNAPETVVDLAGWWFGRALELAGRDGRTSIFDPGEQSTSLLAGTTGEEQVRQALGGLPEHERAAVTLRDGYDLPPQAVAVALGVTQPAAAASVAAGRLHLVAVYDDRRPPDLSGHIGRTTVDVTSLSRLADGSLESPRAAPLRRHAQHCAACEDVLETLSKGRRLAAALPIIALPEEAREAMIATIASRATAVLPTHEAVLRAVDEDVDPAPAVSPLLAVVAAALALVLAIALALVTRPHPVAAPVVAPPDRSSQDRVLPSFSTRPGTDAGSSDPSGTPAPRHSRPLRSSTTSAAPTHAGTTPPDSRRSGQPTGPASLSLSPAGGPAGTTIAVSGSGWTPAHRVTLSYAGRTATTVTASGNGRFRATVQADATLPGPHQVTASEGTRHASATFRQGL